MVLSHVASQSMPLLNERMTGVCGVNVRSWSVHWPKMVTRWVNKGSLTIRSFWAMRIWFDTLRTW